MAKAYEFKLTIGEEKVLYISTLSDLGGDMLKLDFPVGEYELHPLYQGYYLGVKDYAPKNEDAIQVFNDRDGHKGLAGTYHDGDTDNVHRVRIFNDYIGEHLSDEWWYRNYYYEMNEFETDESYQDKSEADDSDQHMSEMDDCDQHESETGVSYQYESETDELCYRSKNVKVKYLKSYNNIPVFFYLTKQINMDDLSNIKLQSGPVINDCGNVNVCWYVIHSTEERIGIAVKQKELYDMMGDQAGLCLFSSNGCRGVGNFNLYIPNNKTNFDEYVFHPGHLYQCEFQPCFCDFEYEYAKQNRIYWKNFMKSRGILEE